MGNLGITCVQLLQRPATFCVKVQSQSIDNGSIMHVSSKARPSRAKAGLGCAKHVKSDSGRPNLDESLFAFFMWHHISTRVRFCSTPTNRGASPLDCNAVLSAYLSLLPLPVIDTMYHPRRRAAGHFCTLTAIILRATLYCETR